MSIVDYGVDLSTVEQPPLLPPGPYPAEIVGATEKTSGKGNRYLNIVFRIHPESYPADFVDGDPDGIELHYNLVQLENSARNRYQMRRLLERIGMNIHVSSVDFNDMIGRTATIETTHTEWQDEQRVQVARVLAP